MPQTRSAKAILHSVAADRADLSTPLTSASPSSDFSAAAASSTPPLPHHQQHHPPAARPLPSLLRRSTRGRAQPAESSPAPVADSFAATPASLPPSPSASATKTQHALTSAASAAVVDATAGPAFAAPLPANLVLDSAPAPNPVPSPAAPALQQVSVGADVPVAAAADDGEGPSAFESSPWRRDSGPTYLRGLFDRGEEAEQTQNRDIIVSSYHDLGS
ncbi:hypothetical protein OC845_002461 [Tilletia horrida]|nr:hypothetical protein OC845_002461 [Tilletia horrida]